MQTTNPRPLTFAQALAACLSGCFLVRAALAIEPPITAIAFAPDGKSVVACSQAGLHVYDWPDLNLKRKIKATAVNIHDLAYSPSGDRLAVGGGTPAEEGVVEIFSWPEGNPLRVLSEHDDSVLAVAWRDKSSLASASLDHSIILWDTHTGSPVQSLQRHSRGVTSLCFLPDGRTLVSAGIDQSLRVWESGKLIRSLSNHTRPIHEIALRPGDSELPMVASVSEDRTVRLWQPTIGRMVRFVRLSSKPLAVEWLTDGSAIVVACTDGHVRVVDPDSAAVTRDMPALDGWAYSLAVHPTDGSVLVGGRDAQLRRVPH